MAYKKNVSTEESEEQMGQVRSSLPWLTIPGGEDGFKTTYLRFLPPRDTHPNNTFFWWSAVHSNLKGSKFPVYCPSKMDNLPCPACEVGNELWTTDHKNEAYEFFASWRALVNVVLVNKKGEPVDKDGKVTDNPKLFLWGVPRTTFEDLMSKVKELPRDELDITSPEHGRIIVVKRKGTKARDTKYEINPADDESPLHDAFLPLIEADDKLIDLVTVYKPFSYNEVKALLAAPATEGSRAQLSVGDTFGAVIEDDDDDEDEDDDNVVEGTSRVLPPKGDKAKAESGAENQLLAKLEQLKRGGASIPFEDDDDDEDEDEEDDD
jgi:hypothetical protein